MFWLFSFISDLLRCCVVAHQYCFICNLLAKGVSRCCEDVEPCDDMMKWLAPNTYLVPHLGWSGCTLTCTFYVTGLQALVSTLLTLAAAYAFQFDFVWQNSFGLSFFLLLLTNLALVAFAFFVR